MLIGDIYWNIQIYSIKYIAQFLTMLSGKYIGTYFNQTNYSVLNNAKQEIYRNIFQSNILLCLENHNVMQDLKETKMVLHNR